MAWLSENVPVSRGAQVSAARAHYGEVEAVRSLNAAVFRSTDDVGEWASSSAQRRLARRPRATHQSPETGCSGHGVQGG